MTHTLRALALALVFVSASVSAAAANVQVSNAWARATVSGQKNAAVYMDVTSDTASAITAVATPLAERGELHSMTHEGGVMRMRPLETIELPAKTRVALAPNGAHVMLVNVKRPLKAGETVPLVLTVRGPGASVRKIDVKAEVRGATEAHGHSHTQHKH